MFIMVKAVQLTRCACAHNTVSVWWLIAFKTKHESALGCQVLSNCCPLSLSSNRLHYKIDDCLEHNREDC